jgi:hypothetical protein
MSHGSTEGNLEEAQHAAHARHDNFTRNVAMTMAIIAAGLAFVTLISHRQHNETIQLQIKSNDNLTKASDQWGYYQAKKNRAYMKEDFAELLSNTAANADKKTLDQIEKWRTTAKGYQDDAEKLKTDPNDGAEALTERAKDYEGQAHESHFTSNFFDVGHLGIEMALVVCSLAVLTRKSIFWFFGIGIAVIGMSVALSGFVLPPLLHHAHEGPAKHEEPKPAEHHGRLRLPSGWELPARS